MGGGVLDYANLAHHLGPDQPFYALQERALAEPGEPFASIEAMARHYVKAIQSVQPDGPYYLGGYCYGGTIAFEMAWRLQRQGFQVNLLAIIDNRPPGKYHRPLWSPAFWAAFLKNLPYWLDDFWQLGPKRMIARLKRKVTLLIEDRQRAAHHAGDTPSLADLEAVLDIDLSGIPEKHYRILIAHYKAMLNYTPQPYQGQVTLFKTQRRSLFGPFDPFMGWNSLAAGGVEIREVVGFHGNLLLEPDVQNLAKELSASLDKAQR
jgi:thioesterase domain-containing protein